MSDLDLFKTAPADVLRYFDAKRAVPTFSWSDIAPSEHAYSWTVAKSAGFDILDDIRVAMREAIANRVPEREFISQLSQVLQDKGWWGKARAFDPLDGVEKTVQLGSPRRLRTIYWANVRTAHAAGEWERTERTKAFLPFLVYTASTAERRRPEHLNWAGTVLPVDHPWWSTHYPPNGWGCRCGVRQISGGEAKRLGWSADQPDPDDTTEPWTNRRTGETTQVPTGIDPGWANNPGKARGENVSRYLYGQVEAMPPERQRIAIKDIVGSPILEAMAQGHMPSGSYLPIAQLASKVVERFGAKTGLVRLSADSVQHILVDHAERGLAVEELRNGLSVVSSPETIAVRDYSHAEAVGLIGNAGGAWWHVAVNLADDGTVWWLNSFHRQSETDAARFLRTAAPRDKIMD
ncbi:hypothetical protein BTE77_27920 [Ensifer adhaerens]|nr:hypothetical protein BTE77_27920 [Ensifer adhaerens]